MRGTKRRYEVQPQLQRDIVNDYNVRDHGYLTIAKKHQLPIQTVRSVIARAEQAGGDPVAPRGHKKRKLDSAEQARLYSSLDRNPFTTNQQLRARVGNKIAEHSKSLSSSCETAIYGEGCPRPGARRTNRGLEGRGTEMVERSQDDCNAQTNLRRRSPHLRE